jgi:hypothetical protein
MFGENLPRLLQFICLSELRTFSLKNYLGHPEVSVWVIRSNVASGPTFNMVWLYRSPIAGGKEAVFLQIFSTCLRGAYRRVEGETDKSLFVIVVYMGSLFFVGQHQQLTNQVSL